MALRLDLDIGDLVLIDNGRVQIRALPKSGQRPSLGLKLDMGETISIGNGRIQIRTLEKTGRRTSLEFIADRSIPIKQIVCNRQQPTKEEEPLPEQEELP